MSVLPVLVLRYSHEQRTEEGMVTLCCDWFEQAVNGKVISVAATGQPFMHVSNRIWPIAYCPFCGSYLVTAPEAPIQIEVEVEEKQFTQDPDGTRRCAKCKHTGHYRRTCKWEGNGL